MKIKDIKDNISIVDLLQKIGVEPTKLRSGEHWYLSPIRSSDTDASFSVNDNLGKWYDHGEGVGGNIIDLALLVLDIQHNSEISSVAQVVRKINQLYGEGYQFQHNQVRDIKVKEKAHEIVSLKEIGNNYALVNYIKSRGVFEAVEDTDLLKELYYDYNDDSGLKKRYFGVGWENLSGGWDVRSKYGKICIDNKNLLYKEGVTDKVLIFEGMFDALTAIQLDRSLIKDHLIVLNSLTMLNKAVDLVNEKSDKIKNTDLFLDHGAGGRKMTAQFKPLFPNAVDRSNLYIGFDDYNNKLVSDLLKKKEFPWKANDNFLSAKCKVQR